MLVKIFEGLSSSVFVGVYGISHITTDDENIVIEEIFKKLNDLKDKNNDWNFLISTAGNDIVVSKILANWSKINNKLYFMNKYGTDMNIDDSNTIVVPVNSQTFSAEQFAVKLSQEFKNENWNEILKTIQDYYILEDYSVMLEKLLKMSIKIMYE